MEPPDFSTLTVDSLVDDNDGDLTPGDISFREALKAVEAGGTIEFSESLATGDVGFGQGVIKLSSECLTARSITTAATASMLTA